MLYKSGVSLLIESNRRYLVLTELFLPTKGGTAVWFAEVYRRLGGKGIHIVTADVPGAEAVDAEHPNSIHRISLKRRAWLRPESLAMYLNLFFKSLATALQHRFEAIHAGRVLPEGLVALLVGRLTMRPVVIYVHGEELTTWGQGKKYRLMRSTLRHADRLIANSDYTRSVLVDMGVRESRITLIYPGVDVDRFRPGLPHEYLREKLKLQADEKLLLSVGRLQRRKGFDRVIECLPGLLAGGLEVHYALIGVGEDQDYLLQIAKDVGVEDRVHLLGHVESDELPRWYNACDLFVMANREVDGDTEGFGIVYVEAAACGKPSVSGLSGGTGSAVEDGVTGLRVDGNDTQSLLQALMSLLSDKERRLEMGQRGLDRVQREFTWERVAEKTRQLKMSTGE